MVPGCRGVGLQGPRGSRGRPTGSHRVKGPRLGFDKNTGFKHNSKMLIIYFSLVMGEWAVTENGKI